MENALSLAGALSVRRVYTPFPRVCRAWSACCAPVRHAPLWWKIRNFSHVWPGLWREITARLCGMNHMSARLYVRKFCADGGVVDYGLVGTQKITTAFVEMLVDSLQGETPAWGSFKYHDCGTGTAGEAVADTTLETPSGLARATGTQTEGISANTYVSVATVTFASSKAITEHGLFNAATGGTLMDRTVGDAYNMVNGESLEFSYRLTVNAGG